MAPQLAGLTRATLRAAPSVCHECVWWQSRRPRGATRTAGSNAEDEWGAWGTVYYDADGDTSARCSTDRPSCSRARPELPAGPPSPRAVLVTCAYLVASSRPWVMQSLFLAAIGDAKDKGASALEAFAYRYPEGERTYERFLVHQTVFPPTSCRTSASSRSGRRARRARPARARRPHAGAEGMRLRVFRALKEALTPAPVPQRP